MRHLREEFEAKWKTGFEADLWVELKPADFEKAAKKDGLEIREKRLGRRQHGLSSLLENQ